MRQHIVPGLIAAVVAGGIGYGTAAGYKPAPVIVQPQTTVIARNDSGLSKAEARQIAAQWGDLDQKEIDALSAALKTIDKQPLTIFCQDDAKCGDLQLDFDNAFETAHWETKLEAPLIDDTIGVGTSSVVLRDAINAATAGRLAVKTIAKNAPYEVLVIGKKGIPKPGSAPVSLRDTVRQIEQLEKDIGHPKE